VLAEAPGGYPADNFYPATWAEVQLGTDYRLVPTSPYKGKGTDGKDPGCDMNALLAAQAGAPAPPDPVPPDPTPVPPVVKKVAWPKQEGKQDIVLAQQWAERYRLKRNLSGEFAEFEKVD